MYYHVQKQGMLTTLLLVLQVSLSASECNLTLNCDFTINGMLTASGNIMSSGGVVSDMNGAITDLLAYVQLNNSNPDNLTINPGFPIVWYALNPVNSGNFTFEAAAPNITNIIPGAPGVYVVNHSITGIAAIEDAILTLARSTDGGVTFIPIANTGVTLPTSATPIEVSKIYLVQVNAGDQFQLINYGAGTITLTGLGGQCSITFLRIHA
jgi:hypothetical protein